MRAASKTVRCTRSCQFDCDPATVRSPYGFECNVLLELSWTQLSFVIFALVTYYSCLPFSDPFRDMPLKSFLPFEMVEKVAPWKVIRAEGGMVGVVVKEGGIGVAKVIVVKFGGTET